MAEFTAGYGSGSAVTVAGAGLTTTLSYLNPAGHDLMHNGWFVFSFVTLCLGVIIIVCTFLSHAVSISRKNLSYDPKTKILTIGKRAANTDTKGDTRISTESVPLRPQSRALVLTKGVYGTNGALQEFVSPVDDVHGFGYVYVHSQINIAARHDNPAPVHIMRMIATFQFDNEESFERETELFEWYDAFGIGDIKPESGPIIVSPGRTLRVATSFIITASLAIEGVDDPGSRCHLPTSAKISALRAVDAFGETYALAEEVPFRVQRAPMIQS